MVIIWILVAIYFGPALLSDLHRVLRQREALRMRTALVEIFLAEKCVPSNLAATITNHQVQRALIDRGIVLTVEETNTWLDRCVRSDLLREDEAFNPFGIRLFVIPGSARFDATPSARSGV